VLQPNTFIETDGRPFGLLVAVTCTIGVFKEMDVAVNVGGLVKVGKGVFVINGVDVNTTGVDEALVTPMMTGVWVWIEGIGVNGRNGVGGLLGNG